MDYTLILLCAAVALLLIAIILLIVLLCRQQSRKKTETALQQLIQTIYGEFDQHSDHVDAAIRVSADDVKGAVQNAAQGQASMLNGLQQSLAQPLTQLDMRMEQLRQSSADGMDAFRRASTASISDLRTESTRGLANVQQVMDTKLRDMQKTLDGRMSDMQKTVDGKLTEVHNTVNEKLTETLNKRLNESFHQVSERLEQVHKGLGEMQTLATGVGDLKKVLTNVKTRGIWGEMQLGTLLGQMLAPEQYMENVAVVPSFAERVEFAVRLPGRDADTLLLPIDSKFPQEDYLRLVNASQSGDPAAVEAARKALRQRILTEAKRISSKYIKPPYTTDFAIMFLPVEGLYAELVRDMDQLDAIQREERIVVAGPSTFCALLNALQMGFRTLAIEQRSSEVWKLLSAVKADFGHFADTLEKTQQRLRQASDTIDTAFSRSRSIEKRLGAVETASEPLFIKHE